MLSAILKRQFSAESQLPRFNYHVRDTIVSLEDGRVACIFKVKGLPFETTNDKLLENQYDSLNGLFLSIARRTGSRLAVWTYLDHYQTEFKTNYEFGYQWLREFSARYMEKFTSTEIFENDFYISLILKPGSNDNLEEVIRELEEIQLTVKQSLRSYEIEPLSIYERGDNLFSQFYEFVAYLYNGFWEPVPVTSLPLYQAVATSTHHHRYALIETRFPHGGNRFMSLSDLKDFPEPTTRGKLNPLLQLPFPFVLCLSFTFIGTTETIRMINQTLNKMESAGDEAVDQMIDMADGKGAVMSSEAYFGELHGAIAVYGKNETQCEDRAGTARTMLSGSCATGFLPATISAPETFFSMFPGNVKRRPRPMPKTTRNLFGLFSMNTYSSGKQFGNPLGDGSAVIPLQTSVGGVYHFNFHYSLPGKDSRGDKRPGHALIQGATGVGKTTFQTAILSHLERFGCRLFAIDKDGSMRGFIEAQGGTYFRLASGEPTGLNPFQLPKTPFSRAYLYDVVEACGKKGSDAPITAEDSMDIKLAVDTVLEMDFELRRFGMLMQSIPDRGENCLKRRLADWCTYEVEGRYAYALDNPCNAFDWETFHRVGFDVSDFLVPGHPATEPILSYLLHLKTLMTRNGGGLLATVVEEFWMPLNYPTTANQILDVLKTGRRRDEFIVLVTQSPEDAIKHPLFPTILQQTATKIFLPNPDAEYKTEDGGGYHRFLSQKEFLRLSKFGEESRMCLIKQGSQTTIVKLDLNGMGDDIAVLAMAAEDFPYLEEAKAQAGTHPDQWVPLYKKLRAAGRTKGLMAA